MTPKWQPLPEHRLRELAEAGQSKAHAADALGTTVTTVTKWAKTYGIEFRDGRVRRDITPEAVRAIAASGASLLDAATQLGVSHTTALRHARNAGVTFADGRNRDTPHAAKAREARKNPPASLPTLEAKSREITEKRRVKFGVFWVLTSLVSLGLAVLVWLVLPRKNVVVSVDRYMHCKACGADA